MLPLFSVCSNFHVIVPLSQYYRFILQVLSFYIYIFMLSLGAEMF